VVDGDPLTDLSVMTNPLRNLKLIMKDGEIYKNELG
jgi:imidazolonepropionase-like amidohydrolase